jgi:hypothetical protein
MDYKAIFEYDERVIDKMGSIAWNALINWETDTPEWLKTIINDNLYPGHSALTYRLSLNNLLKIAKEK